MGYIVQYFYLKSTMSERKCKGRGDVAGIDKKYQLLYCTFQGTEFQDEKIFLLFVFMYYLCGKYYKSITVQNYIAD